MTELKNTEVIPMDIFNNKIFLPIEKIPKAWLNIKAHMKGPFPPLLLPNGQIADFETMCKVFPVECVKQGGTMEELIPIPQEIREAYAMNQRPTPLVRAFRLEKALGLDSDKQKIYFKAEYMSPTGSHKANTAIPQAFYGKMDGLKGIATETGAGQWGSAMAMACSLFGLNLKVFQVRISYNQKPGRGILMGCYGAEILPSPSNTTNTGRAFYDKDPNHPGSLGIAISEAVECAMSTPGYKYCLGSVVDFVCHHQTVIGLEAKEQMKMAGDYPDTVIGCFGGGSNFSGIAMPFMADKLDGIAPNLDIIAAEPMACPKLSKGVYAYDFGDTAHVAPICKMYTVGSSYIPPPVHAGGLRYHGASPIDSQLKAQGHLRSVALHQKKIIDAGILMCKSEGILPAPESCHAIAAAIDEALNAKKNNEKKTILFNFSGHGFFDTSAYKQYLDGTLVDYEYAEADIQKALLDLPKNLPADLP
jgi:tryptophan synthase beta chain